MKKLKFNFLLAIASNNDTGNVYGGTGWHYVKSGAYTWENNTKTGTTW